VNPEEEQEWLGLQDRIRTDWEAGVLIPRHHLARFLALSDKLFTQMIRERQLRRTAERERGQLALPLC
jgi:hypothetical protein